MQNLRWKVMVRISFAERSDVSKIEKVEMSSGYHKKKFDFRPYLEELFEGEHFVFCAKEGEKIVGYISLSQNGEIDYLAVGKKFQGRGFGDKLLKKAISFAKKERIKELVLDVKEENKPAINLYTKNGFEIVKKYKKKVDGKEIRKVRMRLRIKNR